MRRIFCLCLGAICLAVAGCSSGGEQPGYSKADFGKKPVPPGFLSAHSRPPAVPPSVGK